MHLVGASPAGDQTLVEHRLFAWLASALKILRATQGSDFIGPNLSAVTAQKIQTSACRINRSLTLWAIARAPPPQAITPRGASKDKAAKPIPSHSFKGTMTVN